MTVPALNLSLQSAATISADVVVLGVTTSQAGPVLHSVDPAFTAVSNNLVAIGVTGGKDELVRLLAPPGGAGSIALVGLGSEPITPDSLRYAAGSAVRRLTGVDSIAIALPADTDSDLAAVLEGAALGAYSYHRYRTSSLPSTKSPASEITVLTTRADTSQLLERTAIVAGAIHSVKDFVNAPPSDLFPESFATAAVALVSNLPVKVEIFDEEQLRAGGYGGILGVGAGSIRGPRLVKVSYTPDGARRHLALVGKGITFDSGGLSLKQPAGMVGMKYDMTGAATVLAVVVAAAQLNLPIRLTAWLCLAENMPSGSAVRPNDVLRIRGGTTVEVLNTDAEGRLVLADGLVAASEEFPDAIIDVATLTGAARVALGDRYSAVMGDPQLVEQLVATATRTGELLWPMPLPGELRALINSDIADIANAKIGSTAGGMLIAGVFLQEFVGYQRDASLGRIPWAHLDIAGTAHNPGAGYGFTGKGPTGVTVRCLIELAEELSHA